jgi:hypothetical protein
MQYDQSHRPYWCRDPFAASDHVLDREIVCRTVGAFTLTREWVWPLRTDVIILTVSNLSTPFNSKLNLLKPTGYVMHQI